MVRIGPTKRKMLHGRQAMDPIYMGGRPGMRAGVIFGAGRGKSPLCNGLPVEFLRWGRSLLERGYSLGPSPRKRSKRFCCDKASPGEPGVGGLRWRPAGAPGICFTQGYSASLLAPQPPPVDFV